MAGGKEESRKTVSIIVIDQISSAVKQIGAKLKPSGRWIKNAGRTVDDNKGVLAKKLAARLTLAASRFLADLVHRLILFFRSEVNVLTDPTENTIDLAGRSMRAQAREIFWTLTAAVVLVLFCSTSDGQPVFRSPQISGSPQAYVPAAGGRRMSVIKKVSGGTAVGQFQLPQLGASTVDRVPLDQPSDFKNSTLREVGSAGEFLPRTSGRQRPAVELEMPEFDLGALGLVDPSVSRGQDSTAEAGNDSSSRFPLDLGQGDVSRGSADESDAQGLRREKVVENYPDGRPRLIRTVAMDAEGNYYNDGPWVVKNRDGQTIAAGRYKKGVMNGQWGRRHVSSEGGLFITKPFTAFQEPFDSIANFKGGKLDGQWAIYDRSKRTVFEINYDDGKRDGPATWFYPDTTRMRSATFKQGALHGEVSEWDEDGRLTSKDYYHEGRKLVRNTSYYRPKVPKEEAFYLDVKLEQDGLDNWWEAKPAPYSSSGQRVQAGQARAWYANRQLQYRGQFRDDKPVGQFFWWHENGNRSTVGQFDREGNRTGKWIWWHENGLKQIEGSYRDGQPAKVWRSWDEDGQLIKSKSYNSDRESVDPIESIESILDLPGQKPGGSTGEKQEDADLNLKNGIDPAADPADGNSELPLPGSAKSAEPGNENGKAAEASDAEVLESLGPSLDESLLSDEDLIEVDVDPTAKPEANAEKTDEAEGAAAGGFGLEELLGG